MATAGGDRERALSAAGRARSAEVGRALAERGEAIDRVFCSPARRARQTWQEVRVALASPPRATYVAALYDAEADYVAFLHARGQNFGAVLLIGHNPAAHVTALCLGDAAPSPDAARLSRGFPPGGLAIFDGPHPFGEAALGAMRLVAFLAPQDG